MVKQWYETLFENYARTYDKEAFTQGTIQEVDFIEQEIGKDKTKLILDIGCGTGRHSIELTKRGYKVVGVDLSESQLKRAREKATEAGLKLQLEQGDARNLKYNNEFDVVIMLCEGGFPLMETDEMNYSILQSAAQTLKSKGKFIFTTLNALFPLKHSTETFMNENIAEGKSSKHNFDIITLRDYSTFEVADDNGNLRTLHCNERYYLPSEISWMLKSLGFIKIEFFGCDTGFFDRNRKLTFDDLEMLVIAEKS